jgi:hypothetical protein
MYSGIVPPTTPRRTITRRPTPATAPALQLPPDYGPKFYVQLVKKKGQPQLAHLPWRTGADSQMGKKPAETLNDLSVALRACLANATPKGQVRPDAATLKQVLTTAGTIRSGRATVDIKPGEWHEPAAIPALM